MFATIILASISPNKNGLAFSSYTEWGTRRVARLWNKAYLEEKYYKRVKLMGMYALRCF